MSGPERGGTCATCGHGGLVQASNRVLVCISCGSTYGPSGLAGRYSDLITRADARPLLGPDQQHDDAEEAST